MAGKPQPIGLGSIGPDSPTQLHIPTTSYMVSPAGDRDVCERGAIYHLDFSTTDQEKRSSEKASLDIFSYMVTKCSKTDKKGIFPSLKVFLARKSNESVDES